MRQSNRYTKNWGEERHKYPQGKDGLWGGNHRTIHPILQAQGFNGSSNAVYQYILKLRKEAPEVIRKDTIENPPELKLENISRDTVYKQVLKKASASSSSLPAKG